MDINTPYFPTATQLREATPFTNFDSQLAVEYDEHASGELGRAYYKVTKSFRYYLSEDRPDVWAYVPAGFLSDGATVPRPFWWFVTPFGTHGQAAVLHDILCETSTMFRNEIPYQISRKKADQIFLQAMEAAGVGWIRRHVMYAAVRTWSMIRFETSWSKARLARKRQIETEYMKQYGTYREPTAILRQVTQAVSADKNGFPVYQIQ